MQGLERIEKALGALEKQADAEVFFTSLLREGIPEERIAAVRALGVPGTSVMPSGDFRGLSSFARVHRCLELLPTRRVLEFGLACARRCVHPWEELGLPAEGALQALRLAEKWFVSARPTAEELSAAAAVADDYAASLAADDEVVPQLAFAASASRAWSHVATAATLEDADDVHTCVTFIPEFAANAAASYASEVAWQTRILAGLLLDLSSEPDR